MATNNKPKLTSLWVTWAVLTAFGVVLAVVLPSRLMPRSMSTTMHLTILTVVVFSVAAAPVAAGVYAASIYIARHWLHHGDEVPEPAEPVRDSPLVVGAWITVSTLLTIFLLVWGLGALADDDTSVGRNPLVVDVTGQQWVWSFTYPGTNIETNQLVLPEGRTVEFRVTALDVTHGFWIANMGIQVDANPGVYTEIHTTPNALGTFDIRCTQFCGLNHAFMVTTGKVVSKQQFANWLSSESARA